MTTTDYKAPADTSWLAPTAPLPRRRIRGLRITAVPSLPLLAQVGGGGATLCGAYLRWGLAITLIIGGVALVVLGALREAGKV